MMRVLVVLFILVPALEILTIVEVGKVIGGWPTFLLIILFSFYGAYLLKTEGLRTLREIREELALGHLPGDALLDGACILAGGILLLTPGFFTDALGLILLLPFMRRVVKRLIKAWLFRKLKSGDFIHFRRR